MRMVTVSVSASQRRARTFEGVASLITPGTMQSVSRGSDACLVGCQLTACRWTHAFGKALTECRRHMLKVRDDHVFDGCRGCGSIPAAISDSVSVVLEGRLCAGRCVWMCVQIYDQVVSDKGRRARYSLKHTTRSRVDQPIAEPGLDEAPLLPRRIITRPTPADVAVVDVPRRDA